MTMTTGKTVRVLGREYPVELKEGNALEGLMFAIRLADGNELADPTFWGLQKKARDFRDYRFELPFTTKNGVNGTVTGFHATHKGKMLIRWEDGKADQVSSYELDRAMPRLSPEDHAELTRLIEAVSKAKREWDDFVAARQFPGGSVHQAAQAERERKAGLA